MVQFTLFPTPLGYCGIAWRGEVIVATGLPEPTVEAMARRLEARTGGREGKPPRSVSRVIRSMTALLAGKNTDFSFIDCDYGDADPLAIRVYEMTRRIPFGETKTYGDIARQLGDGSLARAVGRALGQNPVPIVVPCHRVIGANGKLTGFSAPGGVETKLRMLIIEGARIGHTPDLFGGPST